MAHNLIRLEDRSSAPSAPAASLLAAKPTSTVASPAPLGARELMDRGNAARLEGHPADAAREYANLYERYPRDARAGLAAFELGRLRLNSLSNPRGALEAFRFALAHPSGGFFSEDAEAGSVDALNRLGEISGCKKARDAFIERHPHSAHAPRIRQMCGDR